MPLVYCCLKDNIMHRSNKIMGVSLVSHIVIFTDNVLTWYMYEVAIL